MCIVATTHCLRMYAALSAFQLDRTSVYGVFFCPEPARTQCYDLAPTQADRSLRPAFWSGTYSVYTVCSSS